jgi:hypothetical protein
LRVLFRLNVDGFVRPCTLCELVALNLPTAAPLLRSIGFGKFYSNYHAEMDAQGYDKECDHYHWVLNRWIRSVLEMPMVYFAYIICSDVLNDLTIVEDHQGRVQIHTQGDMPHQRPHRHRECHPAFCRRSRAPSSITLAERHFRSHRREFD